MDGFLLMRKYRKKESIRPRRLGSPVVEAVKLSARYVLSILSKSTSGPDNSNYSFFLEF
jgi:hypothetical protein